MSTVIAKNIQIGTSGTPAQNFTWYQPAAPDGTVRLGVGNSGVTTGDVITATSAGVTVSGSVTGGTGSFTTLAASSTVSGTGFSNYLASPPAIGGTTPAAVSSTNLSYTGTLTGGTGIVNLGSGQFYKDASGNVGIGTNSPAAKFAVSNGGAAGFEFSPTGGISSGTYIQSYNRSTSAYVANTNYAATHTWYVASTRAMDIDSSGNVGIGTANPSSLQSGTFGQTIAGSFPGLTLSGTETSGRTYTIYESSGALKVYDRNAPADRLAIDSSGNFQFNSGYGSVATAFGCRAWVNFNGTTSPGTIRASGNVSSVTKNGTGDYTVNFATAMPDRNYAVTVGNGRNDSGYVTLGSMTTPTASAYRLTTYNGFSTQVDGLEVYVAVFR